MRLNRIRLAGFKSFVDPTTIHLPGNLTGIVGPNGCGKSNVIDAVRWVMGELSAKHLRGDSMADVIFNGSSARKPVGAASVELLFDNSDGKIGGPYASYSEISLRRVVERDGTSSYFINGGRCRRKDITQLFLGTGLGSRSYAIIEQDMISRVIDARAEDMRAFVEEAAGVSLYKERRRETESRIGETRENLARVSDLRDEVEKQIRHLQRQANAARRYQELRGQERALTAELLALRLREVEATAGEQTQALDACERSLQAALAQLRAAEVALEKQRELYGDLSEALARVQGRYYELGAQVTRAEESIRYQRELRERARADLTQLTQAEASVAEQIRGDEAQLSTLRRELSELEPQVAARSREEQVAAAALTAAEAALTAAQQRWEALQQTFAAAAQSEQVEATRIEQLERQQQLLRAQADRLAQERELLTTPQAEAELAAVSEQEAAVRQLATRRASELSGALERVQQLREAQQLAEGHLERERRAREQLRAELWSLEALQKAALQEKSPQACAWLASVATLSGQPRLAETVEVRAGWERAVETVLGDYLEAVAVPALAALEPELARLESGQVSFFERPPPAGGAVPAGEGGSKDGAAADHDATPARAETLAAQLRGPAALRGLLERVRTVDSLAAALRLRPQLTAAESVITPAGEWLGRDWLRVNRGGEVHAGVLEREHRLKSLRERAAAADELVRELEREVAALRSQQATAEQERDRAQAGLQDSHQAQTQWHGQLQALKARLEQGVQRRERIESEDARLALDASATVERLTSARSALGRASAARAHLESQRHSLEAERERLNAEALRVRTAAQSEQRAVHDLLIRLESRRAAESSRAAALERLLQQRASVLAQRRELEHTLAVGDAPITALDGELQQHLARRHTAEAELASARTQLEGADEQVRALDQRRVGTEQQVAAVREQMEQARLAVQESRLRCEALLEQFAATHCELESVRALLPAEAQIATWEQRLEALRADIERCGQVNLAAIGELTEQSERKAYLDSQFNDVSEALQTLEQAMRKIDRETRSRFEDTFRRINDGLQEKFPRLFGGGHAYLELVGDDPVTAGVAVMARPPGKRNSLISQLSGGEKALTAVALVFSIFDLNPAPFCLLDEVDAPLDEHNVGRFCDIVQDMSRRVQFIFITHNKVTMELASQLIGVTMNEPGVSRLVTVDLDDAVRLAAV
jgi:chromosome segregation protein